MFDIKTLLAKLVSFDTTSAKPNRACIDFIRDYLDGLSIKSEIIADDKGKACLWATVGAADEPGIVLAGHTDTVPVEGQDWSSDPFTLTARGDKLHARGACDMKGFIACVLAALPELVKSKTQTFHLAFTHDEETDMSGAVRLTDYMRTKGITPAWVWIGEPTSLRIIDSHKGVAAFATNITGIPAHSGQPDKGLSAIEFGNDFMNILRRTAQQKKDKAFSPSRFDPPYTTINLGVVKGGTAENIIAEHFELLWQTRAHPGDDLRAMLTDIDRAVATDITPRMKAFPKAGLRTCTCCDIPPLMPTKDNPGEKILARLTGNSQTEAVSFATEGGFFQKLGSPVVICGPGSIDQAHKADEYVEKAQLSSCIDLIRQVLLCSGAA